MIEKKNKQRTFRVLSKLTLVLLWMLILFGAFEAYKFYQYEKAHPQKEYEYGIYSTPPEEVVIKVEMYNRIRNIILIGVVLIFVHFTFDYLYKPENHFYNDVKRWINKLNKLEE